MASGRETSLALENLIATSDRIFWRIAMLILVFFAAMLLYRIVVQRWAPPRPPG